jgi:hypothetical protein
VCLFARYVFASIHELREAPNWFITIAHVFGATFTFMGNIIAFIRFWLGFDQADPLVAVVAAFDRIAIGGFALFWLIALLFVLFGLGLAGRLVWALACLAGRLAVALACLAMLLVFAFGNMLGALWAFDRTATTWRFCLGLFLLFFDVVGYKL